MKFTMTIRDLFLRGVKNYQMKGSNGWEDMLSMGKSGNTFYIQINSDVALVRQGNASIEVKLKDGIKLKRYDDKFTPPFRVGMKQSRAVLDSKGHEVVIFPCGHEEQALLYCDYLNL